MRRVLWASGLLLGLAAGCTPAEHIPDVKIPAACEEQVYADPAVKDQIMKAAGSVFYRNTHQMALAYAKLDAVRRCEHVKGLSTPGGGVEQPRRPE